MNRDLEKLEEKERRIELIKLYKHCLRDRLKDLGKILEDGAITPEEYEVEARKAEERFDKLLLKLTLY